MPHTSCILATKDRPQFLGQALKYYLSQTYTDSELIIVDDSATSCAALVPHLPSITYIYLPQPTSLGTKLNVGIERASGTVIQKLDDDDYYHSSFLTKTVSRLDREISDDAVVAVDPLLVLIAGHDALFDAGGGWFAGGTLCFYRSAWRRAPFRDVPRRVDVFFLEDHPEFRRLALTTPEIYVLVRHGRHTWNSIVPETVVPVANPGGIDVTEYFLTCPRYPRTIEQVVGVEHGAFYRSLAQHQAGLAGREVGCGS
ncbi:MAG: glycosyltransferase family 2 protein [Bryobacterales bacterium]|nr:glycosyltransferase family 2 protein [Bryobacterales bacterium]